MAARVNSRFIIIMLAVVSMTAGAVAALWYWQSRADVERLVQQGDELFEQGQHRRAMEMYGRAIRRQPGNVEWVHKLEQSIVAQRPETAAGARDLYDRWMLALRLAAEYQATDPDAQLRLIQELHDTARLIGRFIGEGGQRTMWREVASAGDQMLLRVPESESRRAYGLLYRGMGTIEQRHGLTEENLRQAEEDLAAFLEAMPDHDRGWAALARAQLVLEEQARIAGDPRRLAERRQRLAEVMRDARAAVPEGPEVSTAYAMYLTRPDVFPQGAPRPSESDFRSAMDSMVSAVSRTAHEGDPAAQWLTLEAVNVLLEEGSAAGLATATRLVQDHIADDAGAVIHRLTLADLLMRGGNFREAEGILESILAMETMQVGFASRMQPEIQTAAAGLQTEIEYRRWTMRGDEDAAQHIRAMRDAIDRLDQLVTDPENDQRMVSAKGRLALMEGRYNDAAAHFEQLIRARHTSVDVLFSSSYALQRIGELGLAHERVSAVTARPRTVPAAFLVKAELELALGRLEDADASVRTYRDLSPPDDDAAAETASRLLRTIAARKQGLTHDEDDPVQSAIHRADMAAREGGSAGHESARAILVGALETHPEDVRILAALATVEMNAGDPEAAGGYLTRALAIAPDHPVLRQLDLVARSGDPVDAAVQFFADVEDEVERNAAVLNAMTSIRAQGRAVVEALNRRTSLSEAEDQVRADARSRIERAEAIMAEASERLRDLAPDHPSLIEHEFNQAIANRDWTLASQIVQRARRHNTDLMNGLLYEGRFELERRPARPEHAVRAFQQATEQRPFSNRAWRGLAISYQQVGNFREALRAYEQAYSINPSDSQTIRGYLALLLQTGDRNRAMRVGRDAARALPGDVEMRELWLELEAEHDNLAAVLDRRREIYRTNPGDRLNAMRLALLLTQAEPRFDLLRDAVGKPLYTERQWNQMRVSEQRRILEEHRRHWQTTAERIVNELFERDAARTGADAPPDLEIVALRAALLRHRGDVAGGERVLRDHIALLERTNDRNVPLWRAMLALANYQTESGLVNEAVATMRRAQDVQDQNTREADLALADFLFSRGQFEQAKALYEAVLNVAPRRVIELRIVECAVNLRQFDQAESVLARLSPASAQPTDLAEAAEVESGGDFMVEMLRAMVARGRADDMLLRGQRADAERQVQRFHAALNTAERLAPSNPAPHILRAQASTAEYRRTKERTHIDAALAALDRAEAIRAGDPQTAMARVEVHREAGNTRSAISELNRLLERDPTHVQARRLLTQLHLDGGNIQAAIESIERAIEVHPTVATWHEILGNIHASPDAGPRASRAAASAAYRKAFDLAKSPVMLSRLVSTYIAPDIGAPNDRPEFAAALQILQSERDLVQQEPALEALLAHVLVGTGRESEGRQRLAQSYKRFREQIAAGARPPADIGAWYQSASLALAPMSVSEIEEMIRRQGEGLPDRFDLLFLGRREAGRGPQHLPAAVDLLRRAVDSPGADGAFRTNVLMEMSAYQIGMKAYGAAADVLAEVVSASPNNWVAHNNLAFVMADRLDQADAAIPHALKALEMRPNDAAILDTVGWVYHKTGDHERAEEFLLRSLTLNESARTLVHLAEVLIETGRFDSALARLRRAAELNPDAETQADIDRLTDDIRTRRASAE